MNREIEMFLQYAESGVQYFNSRDAAMLHEIANNMHRLKPFEKPDMVLPLSEKIMIIEHFQFDASKFKAGKGNIDKALLSQRNSKFDKLVKTHDIKSRPLIDSTKVDCEYKAEYYTDNLTRVFNEHYSKIDSYKEHIIESGLAPSEESIITAFLAVDTTPLGNHLLVDGDPNQFCIFQLKHFIELLDNSPSIDYIFHGYFNGRNNTMAFMSNTPESRGTFSDHLIDFEVDEYFHLDPMETRFCFTVDPST